MAIDFHDMDDPMPRNVPLIVRIRHYPYFAICSYEKKNGVMILDDVNNEVVKSCQLAYASGWAQIGGKWPDLTNTGEWPEGRH